MEIRTLTVLEYDKIRDMLQRHVASAPGKEIVARMRPARDEDIVRQRLAETTQARNFLAEQGEPPFGGLRDLKEHLTRAEKLGVLTAQELLHVADAAACSRRLRRLLLQTDQFPLLRAQAVLLGEFLAVERAIDDAITAQGEVMDHASPELSRLRQRVKALHEAIQRELQRIISAPSYADVLQEPIITQRNGRFCVPVRAEQRNSFKGIVHDLSASGQTAFMEPLPVVELGNDLREATRREEEEVQRILAALSSMVGAVRPALQASLDAAARLDAIFARAQFARALDATEPELNTNGVIDLIQARHPLLGESAVPIDLAFGESGQHTLLITGSNTGGKTVTLKTLGLLTLMAQSGLHIPAKPGSRLAIFTQLFADIGDEQSIEQSLSTFSGHMTNIVRIMKEAGPRAIILFDEIGAGTDPAEGASLAKAILLELHARGCRTVATTHYGELKVFAQNTEGFLNASVEFDLETLRPTYRVIAGLPGSSYALAISQRLGLPKTIIQRAKELMGEAPQAIEHALKQADGVRRALDRERTAAVKARREAEEISARLQRKEGEFDQQRESLLARARQQAQDVLRKSRLEANSLLDELKLAVREHREHAASVERLPDTAALRRRTRETFGELTAEVESLPVPPPQATPKPRRPVLTEVLAGQPVYVRSLGHRGTALQDGAGDAEVEVQVGIMRVRVAVSDLEAAAVSSAVATPLPVSTARPVDAEIQLLGKRAEEAAHLLDDYLYDALESGLSRVRIVHGFGTGTLKTVVLDVLRHHPGVRSYRAGESREGGGGVTVAEIGRG